jgi:AbiV family abortive infection protein
MDTETFNTTRRAILANARSLLHAAEKLAAEDVDHVRYHLAALCLEEVGKVGLIGMRFVAGLTDTEAPSSVEGQLEDHVKKLFWAIWGPSFGREPLTREQIEQHRGLATHIHDKRLFSLYSDPDVPLLPSEKITGQEADSLVGMARVRLGLENAQEPTSLQVTDELRWFLQASDDPEKRRHIFGTKSLEKLAELGNARAWVGWLREVYQDHDAQMQVLIQKEINRTPARDRTSAKAKWRIKFRIYSHSHSIRKKAFNVWNERTDFIRLDATGERRFTKNKKDEIVATISLDDSVPVGALWHFGWGIARSFVIALNIGTRGFFWWYVPSDTAGWYDEIWDVENNAGVRVTEGPKLEIGWGNRVLTDNDIAHTAVAFRYIAACRGTPKEGALNAYIGGVVFLSKLDFHWRCELNAFEQFWTCFRETLRASWDGESDLKAAATAALQEVLSDTTELHSHIDLGIQFDAAMPKPERLRQITLTDVIGMKLYCDLLLLKDAVKSLEKDTAPT